MALSAGQSPGFGVDLFQLRERIFMLGVRPHGELARFIPSAIGLPTHVHPVNQLDARAQAVEHLAVLVQQIHELGVG